MQTTSLGFVADATPASKPGAWNVPALTRAALNFAGDLPIGLHTASTLARRKTGLDAPGNAIQLERLT